MASAEALLDSLGSREVFDDSEVMEFTSLLGALQRVVGASTVALAAEVVRRSEQSLGSTGLAQRLGFRTPEKLVASTTGVSGRESVTVLRAARLVDVATREPWLGPLAVALADSSLSAAAAESIARGLGHPNSAITVAQLEAVAAELCLDAATFGLGPDQLFRRARDLRDELDLAGVRIREDERRAERSVRLVPDREGGGRLIWHMDPETFAVAKELCDRATSPRLGGPRFVDDRGAATAAAITADSRTTEQLLSDALLDLMRLGAATDPVFLLGSGAPVVRITVTKQALTRRTGVGRLEGQPGAVSIETVERMGCAGETVQVSFDEQGNALDVGREQRFYTRRQRIALAVRDGGCRWPDCERPPSYTEAHHTRFWMRDNGKTDVADGILLCRHHHLLAHNNNWEIEREGADFWLTPPPDVDPRQQRIALPSRSAAMRDLARISA
jgi:hypothetical protein